METMRQWVPELEAVRRYYGGTSARGYERAGGGGHEVGSERAGGGREVGSDREPGDNCEGRRCGGT